MSIFSKNKKDSEPVKDEELDLVETDLEEDDDYYYEEVRVVETDEEGNPLSNEIEFKSSNSAHTQVNEIGLDEAIPVETKVKNPFLKGTIEKTKEADSEEEVVEEEESIEDLINIIEEDKKRFEEERLAELAEQEAREAEEAAARAELEAELAAEEESAEDDYEPEEESYEDDEEEFYDDEDEEDNLIAFERKEKSLGRKILDWVIMVVCCAAVIGLAFVAVKFIMNKDEQVPADGNIAYETSAPVEDFSSWNSRDKATTPNYEIGGRVFFGRYPQGPNGEEEEIAWIVVAANDTEALLVSEYAIDALPYDSGANNAWEISEIRDWLKGKFYGMAFGDDEKGRIVNKLHQNPGNPVDADNGCEDTLDAVWLLGIYDIDSYFREKSLACAGTPYAINKGLTAGDSGNVTYWLRSPGEMTKSEDKVNRAACVDYTGNLKYYGNDAAYARIGVRPAIWIKK